ncbi:MAG: peptide deformylase [Kouleothrix sp.]
MFQRPCAYADSGLAAPQIGITQRIAVVWIRPGRGTPRRHNRRDQRAELRADQPRDRQAQRQGENSQEGCLSLPGRYGEVPRAIWVTVDYLDLDGKRRRIRKASGLLGRALQHELDRTSTACCSPSTCATCRR